MPDGLPADQQFHGDYSPTTSPTTTPTTTTTAKSAGIKAEAVTSHLTEIVGSGSYTYPGTSVNIDSSHVAKVSLAVEEKADDAHTVRMEFGDLSGIRDEGCIVEALVGMAVQYYENKHPDRTKTLNCENICCFEIDTCSDEGCKHRRRSTDPAATISVGPAVVASTTGPGPAPERPSEAFPGFSDAMVATPTALAGLALLIEVLASRSGSGPGYGLVSGQRGFSIFNPVYDVYW